MASDSILVERLSSLLNDQQGIEARRMFGGICFMLNGNMCVGVHNKNLILRVGSDRVAALLGRDGVKPMDLTGKVMKGWATVLPEAVGTEAALASFTQIAVDYVSTLPPK